MTIAEGITSAQGAVSNAGMKATDYVNQLTSGKIKVKPKGLAGIGGFVFDYEAEANLTLEAEITDHYAENGSVLNDHRVVKPLRITLRGFVCEIVHKRTAGISGLLSTIQNKLTTVDAYLGKYTPQALSKVQGMLTQAQNLTDKINNYADSTKNIVGMFQKALPGKTKQEKAFNTLLGLHNAGTVFTIQNPGPWRSPIISAVSPWGMLDDMMIETVHLTQSEDNNQQTDISVTLKQVRFADTQETTVDPTHFSDRASKQTQPLADKGATKGATQNVSLLYSGFIKP